MVKNIIQLEKSICIMDMNGVDWKLIVSMRYANNNVKRGEPLTELLYIRNILEVQNEFYNRD